MQIFTLVIIALHCIAQTFAYDLPGCNEEIIKSIKNYWAEHGTPKNVMNTLKKNGRGILLYASDILPVQVTDDDPKCVKGEFTKTLAKFTVVPKNGILSAAKVTVSYEVYEEDGIITEGDCDVTKYIIVNKGGVTGFYTCKPNGDNSDADPAAGLAVAVHKIKAAKHTIAESKAILENEFGFEFPNVYDNKECAK